MPIKDVSSQRRIPRLGKIRLGVKVKPEEPGKHPYPKATGYFVVPPEVAEVFGEKPTELEIMFPIEDETKFCQQWLRAYSLTQGLVCIGDGVTSKRKIDTATGEMASYETKEWVWKDELTCAPQECPEYLSKHCRRVMNLQVLIPDVLGLGVWQIDTSSYYSIVNINSMIDLLKGMLGRCSMIPLTLALGPVEVSPPGQKKKTVYIMHIKSDVKLSQLAKVAQLPPVKVLLPEPETEEPPADLFPEQVLAQAETVGEILPDEEPPIEAYAIPEGKADEPTPRDKLITQLNEIFDRLGWLPTTREAWCLRNAGYKTFEEMTDEVLEKLLVKARPMNPLKLL